MKSRAALKSVRDYLDSYHVDAIPDFAVDRSDSLSPTFRDLAALLSIAEAGEALVAHWATQPKAAELGIWLDEYRALSDALVKAVEGEP